MKSFTLITGDKSAESAIIKAISDINKKIVEEESKAPGEGTDEQQPQEEVTKPETPKDNESKDEDQTDNKSGEAH